MNKRQKEVQQSLLSDENEIIKQLKSTYEQASKDCEEKIRQLSVRSDMENLQSIIYQKQYQEILKSQIDSALENLQNNEYSSISDYLTDCYENGFMGTLYDLHGQGVPLIFPIDQRQVTQAVRLDSQISEGLYTRLGEDTTALKSSIRAEVSRGIANGSTYNQTAANIALGMNSPFKKAYNNAIRIARTEGRRIQNQAQMDTINTAAQNGADIVKQWCSTLDDRTRYTHQQLDGQIREIDEPFEINGLSAMYPLGFGNPAEDCNCRCCMLQIARWALDESELRELEERAEYFGLDKTEDFEDFKNKYLNAVENSQDSGIMNTKGVKPVIISSIEQPIEQRNTGKGNPNAVLTFGTDLNNRQKELLAKLPSFDSKVTVSKSSVNMSDLSSLTAYTGDEFAMFTKGGERLIIRGNSTMVNISVEDAQKLADEGYRWSGHTHPGNDMLSMFPSDGDKAVLRQFKQGSSVIYNSKGQYVTFEKE